MRMNEMKLRSLIPFFKIKLLNNSVAMKKINRYGDYRDKYDT